MSEEKTPSGLRIVTFNVLPPAHALVMRWAAQAGHKVVLTVTTPGPVARRSTSYQGVVAQSPPEGDVLVTTRLRSVAAPLIRAVQPDLVVSMTFPYRIPPEIRSIPRYGAINLHPTPLPAYRGPNVMRLFYEGWPVMGATLHWMDDDFDTGRILSQHTAPLPTNVTQESIFEAWLPLMTRTLAEGAARALAGEAGEVQNESGASYAAAFSEAEHWLSWQENQAVVQRKATALNLFGPPQAKAQIAGQPFLIERVEPLPASGADAAPGTVISQPAENQYMIAVGDGAVQVRVKPFAAQ